MSPIFYYFNIRFKQILVDCITISKIADDFNIRHVLPKCFVHNSPHHNLFTNSCCTFCTLIMLTGRWQSTVTGKQLMTLELMHKSEPSLYGKPFTGDITCHSSSCSSSEPVMKEKIIPSLLYCSLVYFWAGAADLTGVVCTRKPPAQPACPRPGSCVPGCGILTDNQLLNIVKLSQTSRLCAPRAGSLLAWAQRG